MKYDKPILTGILLSASLALGANDLFGQTLPGPNVPTPKRDLAQPTDPIIPGKPAQGVPGSQPIPGQRGTIPEQMEPRDAVSQREMVVSSDDIRRAQEALKAKGRDPGAISGRMHAKTQEALREFQKANDLPATGVLDKKTAENLGITLKGDKDSTPQKREDGTKRESKDSTKREQQ
jgi:hypothetical protein